MLADLAQLLTILLFIVTMAMLLIPTIVLTFEHYFVKKHIRQAPEEKKDYLGEGQGQLRSICRTFLHAGILAGTLSLAFSSVFENLTPNEILLGFF